MTTESARQPEADAPERTERAGPSEARPLIAGAGGGAASRVLALQRAAGNRAVTALLARDPTPNAPPAKPAPPAPKTTSAVIAEIGTIPLLSVSLSVVQRGSGGGAPNAPSKPDITLISEVGPHSGELFLAAASGQPLTVEIVMVRNDKPYARIKLTNAQITSMHSSGSNYRGVPVDDWTVSARNVEVQYEKGAPGGG